MSGNEELKSIATRIYEIVEGSSNEYDAVERIEDYLSLIFHMKKSQREDLSREG
jgi:hypothetical protein